MKKNIAYWLLARFPRPVAVLYAMLVQAAIDNFDKLILVAWLLLILAGFIFFGLNMAAACVVVPLILLFMGVAFTEFSERYDKFDEALPKREKKDKEE